MDNYCVLLKLTYELHCQFTELIVKQNKTRYAQLFHQNKSTYLPARLVDNYISLLDACKLNSLRFLVQTLRDQGWFS